MYKTRTQTTSAPLKGSDAIVKGFPKGNCPASERKLRSSAQKRLDFTQSNSDTICGYMTSSEKETHARRLGTEDTETHIEGLRSSADAQENSLHHSPCLKTQIQTRPTKNSPLQQHCLGAVQGLNLSSTGHSPGVKILEQPVATLTQRTDHLGRQAGALQIVSNTADRRVKVSNSKLRSHSWKKQRRASGGTRTRTRSSADRPPLTGG